MKDYMLPATCIHTRKVVLYCHGANHLWGFKFFNGDNALLFKIGNTSSNLVKKTVVIEADEQIIGVKAKLFSNYQAVYTDFQFMVCKQK
jgi:hypothetical protein